MADDQPLSDNQVHDRLNAASEALGEAPGITVRGQTALDMARKVLSGLQLAVLLGGERATDPDAPLPGFEPER